MRSTERRFGRVAVGRMRDAIDAFRFAQRILHLKSGMRSGS